MRYGTTTTDLGYTTRPDTTATPLSDRIDTVLADRLNRAVTIVRDARRLHRAGCTVPLHMCDDFDTPLTTAGEDLHAALTFGDLHDVEHLAFVADHSPASLLAALDADPYLLG